MNRSFPFATLATGLFATGFALFPVLARDVATTEFYDPFEPLVPESVQASAPAAPAVVPPPAVARVAKGKDRCMQVDSSALRQDSTSERRRIELPCPNDLSFQSFSKLKTFSHRVQVLLNRFTG